MIGVTGQSLFVPSVGVLLLFVFGLQLGWFPIGGAYDTRRLRAWPGTAASLQHLVLPAVSLMLVQLGSYVLTMRSTLIEALGEDYCDPGQGQRAAATAGCCGSTRCATRCCRPRP